jgi:hypothetical protein
MTGSTDVDVVATEQTASTVAQEELNAQEQADLFWQILDMGYVGIVSFQHPAHGLTLLTIQEFVEPDQFGLAFYVGDGTEAPLSLAVCNRDEVAEQLLSGEMKSRWSFFPFDSSFNPSLIELHALVD